MNYPELGFNLIYIQDTIVSCTAYGINADGRIQKKKIRRGELDWWDFKEDREISDRVVNAYKACADAGLYVRPLFGELILSRVLRLCVGMTVEECIERIRTAPDEFNAKDNSSLRLEEGEILLKVSDTVFSRYSDNERRASFDTIRASVSTVSTMGKKDLLEWLSELANRKHVFEYVCKALEKNRTFKKYGVPVEYIEPYFFGAANGMIDVCLKLKTGLDKAEIA